VRILYLSLSYLPSRRASSVQVTKMCAALARRGHEVVLVAKQGRERTTIDDHAFYRVERNFEIDKIARPAFRGGGGIYAAGMAARIARRRSWADVVYCRDPFGAWLAAELGMPTVFEAHEVPESPWIRRGLQRALGRKRAIGLVAISEALRRDLQTTGLAGTGAMVVAHDACDPPETAVQRRSVHAPPTIGYVGNLYAGRGIETILELARAMPACRFRVIGGTDVDLARWRAADLPANLELLGFRPQAELAGLYRELDVVLMPHAAKGVVGATGSADISKWTSPMKMFEYMSSGIPLVASRLPVLEEVLRDGENALLVPSDDLAAWQAAIERLISDDDLRFRLAQAAQQDLVQHYTWDARAEVVMTGLGLET
jgi:glycosyltransferase involved in cell wall biosynthesis